MEQFLQHITTEGERWDQLAWYYYGDPMAYERLIQMNPHVAVSNTLPAGILLAIPVIDDTQTSENLPPWLR